MRSPVLTEAVVLFSPEPKVIDEGDFLLQISCPRTDKAYYIASLYSAYYIDTVIYHVEYVRLEVH